jgi:hypothetical protein
MSPGVEDDENENDEADHQQYDELGLALPDLPDAAFEIFQVHPTKPTPGRQKGIRDFSGFPVSSHFGKKNAAPLGAAVIATLNHIEAMLTKVSQPGMG